MNIDEWIESSFPSGSVEDCYRLSPAQEAILLHVIREPRAGLFFQQMVKPLVGLNVSCFIEAWKQVIGRHSILRSSFHWEDVAYPVQVVHREVAPPVDELDYTDVADDLREQKLNGFLLEDRRRRFDLAVAPLLRLTLIRWDDDYDEYTLVKSHHHLLLDGWSGPLLFGEVEQVYRACVRGRVLRLPPAPQFRIYVDWLEQQDTRSAERFWRDHLSGFRSPTPLPGASTIHAPGGRFAAEQLYLPVAMATDLRNLARRIRVTPGILLEGAWALLLALWSGEDDVVFGVTFSGRSSGLHGIERIIGLFLNSLPIRVTLPLESPLQEWLGELHRLHAKVQAYEYSAPEQVQDWSEMPKGAPLFNTLVTYNSQSMNQAGADEAAPARQGRSQDSRWRSVANPTHFDLSLIAAETKDSLVLKLTANAEHYNSATLSRLLGHIRLLLDAFIDDPRQPLNNLSLMTPQDWHLVIHAWNQTDVDYPRDRVLHQLFEASAASHPDRPAVFFGAGTVSFAELNRKANRLAHYLRGRGAAAGTLVGVATERGMDMVVAVLSVLKSGAAYVPLDPNYPRERLALLIEDSALTLVLTELKVIDRLPECSARVILIDADSRHWADESEGNPARSTSPEDLALVVYTSGSTGKPKGVAMPHRVCVNRMFTEPDPVGPDDVFCAETSLNFIDSIWEMCLPWTFGRPTVLLPAETIRDPQLLIAALAERDVTRIVLVPSLLRTLLESEPRLAECLPHLYYWICSGEPLPPDLVSLFKQRLGERVLTNLYGTSETWDVTRCDTRQIPTGNELPIGHPMGNCRVYVLDRQLRPVPVGVAGELCVGGDGVALGYHRRPDLTVERFIPDTFGERPNALIYRTGDQVRWLPEGNLEFLGRTDFQLKIRGFRVEPKEVESALREHPNVRNAAVASTEQQQLVAYVVFEDKASPTPATELRQHAERLLPSHLTPTLFMPVNALPLTPSGKIDRRALPQIDSQQAQAASEYVEPRTPMERAIADAWQRVLKVDRLGVNDNFFDLGGHSLLATKAITLVSKSIQVNVPVHVIFEHPSVAGLAKWIDEHGDNHDSDAELPLIASPVDSTGSERRAPLSFGQQRMWFLSQLAAGSALYNTLGSAALEGTFDATALERTLNELVCRHESLRTTFATQDGELFQVIALSTDIPFETADLRDFPEEQRGFELQRVRQRELARPFDLAQGPIIRFTLVFLTEHRQVLLFAMHHIGTDGWSMGIMRNELRTIYEAFRHDRPCPLPKPRMQYADFALWQRSRLKGETLDRHLDYWRAQLARTAHLELTTDRPRPTMPRYKSAKAAVSIADTTVEALRRLARDEEATQFMVLMAAFQYVLGQNAGQPDDIVVGTPIANRTRAELSGVIGFFVNTLAIRSDLSGEPSFRTLLARVRKTCLDAYAHQDLPFDRLVDELAPQRNLQVQPIFQVLFVLENLSEEQEGARSTQADTAESTFFDLTLSLTESESQIEGNLLFNNDLFDRESAERLVRHFQVLLEHVADKPDQRLGCHSITPEAERRQLMEWTRTPAAETEVRCVQWIVEKVAERYPEREAVVFDDEVFTYSELEHSANRLARWLLEAGIAPEACVGLHLERSAEAIVAVLAILRAGGVYLPLNPELPVERLQWIIDDAKPDIVLTNESLHHSLPETPGRIVDLDRIEQELVELPASRPETGVHPQNLAYIIYTSGSTGAPKGVMIEHRSLSHTVTSQAPLFELGPGARVLATHALSFDASLGEIFRTLVSGACLHIAHREHTLPGPELIHMLRAQHITTLTLPAFSLEVLPFDEDLPDLKTISTGGEALSEEVALRWGKDRRLLNGYGPTETTIGATLATERSRGKRPTIGRPLPGVCAYVLNSRMQLVPQGVPGELFLGGPGLARGYLNQPELTAEHFVDSPFPEVLNSRLYKTGDKVRWRSDGQLEFLGRLDDQVKIRGHRVEPGEIVNQLKQHALVRDAAVVAQPNQAGSLRLIAYLVLSGQSESSPGADSSSTEPDKVSEVRRHLASRLPDYMVPSAFVPLETIPLTAHGKLDIKSLPEPDSERLERQHAHVAPTSRNERILAEIWQQMLNVDNVGIHDNFFELGGDSILSIRVIIQANQSGLNLSTQDVYRFQTIAEQAAAAETAGAASSNDGEVSGDVPLTPIQHWFFEGDIPEPHLFSWSTFLTTPHGLNEDNVKRVVSCFITHHDALRMRFVRSAEGSWRQFCGDIGDELPLTAVNLSALAEDGQFTAMESAAFELQDRLNLSNGPILRIGWFDLGPRKPGRALLIVHHLVIDIISWATLLADLVALFRQEKQGRALAMPAKTSSFQQWAKTLVGYTRSGLPESDRAFWLDSRYLDVPGLPRDFPNGIDSRASEQTHTVILGSVETERMEALARRAQLEIDELLVSIFGIALARWSGQTWIQINVERDCRDEIGTDLNLSRSVGWFSNISPVLFELPENTSLEDALEIAIEELRSVPNRGLGYGLLRYLSDAETREEMLRQSPVEAFFSYLGKRQDRLAEPVDQMGLAQKPKMESRLSQQGLRRHLIEVNAVITQGNFKAKLAYSANIHRHETVETLGQIFVGSVEALC